MNEYKVYSDIDKINPGEAGYFQLVLNMIKSYTTIQYYMCLSSSTLILNDDLILMMHRYHLALVFHSYKRQTISWTVDS